MLEIEYQEIKILYFYIRNDALNAIQDKLIQDNLSLLPLVPVLRHSLASITCRSPSSPSFRCIFEFNISILFYIGQILLSNNRNET